MITTYAQLAKRLPSIFYKIGTQMFIDRSYPRHLFIETTANCNLRCRYCPREQSKENMDFGLFRKIIDEASRFGPRSFSLHLFGEPLLYPFIFEACSYIKSRNSRHTILLTTNGTKINECIDDIISSGIDQMLWTWRREARFRESTLLKLRQWGKFRVRFIEDITSKEGFEEWKNWPNVERRTLHNYGGDIDTSAITGKPIVSTKKRWPCYHLWLAPAVSWNGNILMCCTDPHQKEILGTYPNETVTSVWQGQRLQQLRRSHIQGRYRGICKDCNVWKAYPNLFFFWQYGGYYSSGNF